MASPAPLKMPLIRKSNMITMLPPMMMRVYPDPILTASSSAPMNRSMSAAYTNPGTLIIDDDGHSKYDCLHP